MKKDYGYRINISQKPYSELYERYKKYKNIPRWCPLSDYERFEFEQYIMRMERKQREENNFINP